MINKQHNTMRNMFKRAGLVICLVAFTIAWAVAALGDGKSVGYSSPKTILVKEIKPSTQFSLKSGYDFRGNNVITRFNDGYFTLNTTITHVDGKPNLIMPVTKKVPFNGKVSFKATSFK